jgi:hypothetical protein
MIKEFLRDKSMAHLLMLAALILLLVSQFFYYFDDPTTGRLNRTSDGAFIARDGDDGSVIFGPIGDVATGWDLHPQAYVILAILAFAFLRSEIFENVWFRRIGWWVAVGLIVWAINPGAPFRATGAAMGGIASLMALTAAVLNLLSRKTVATSADTSKQ